MRGYRIVPGSYLERSGQVHKDLRHVAEVFYGNFSDKIVHRPTFWRSLFSLHPNQEVFLLNSENKPLGVLHLIPLLEAQYQSVLHGKFNEELLTTYAFEHALQARRIYLFLNSFIIHPDVRDDGYLREMWNVASRLWSRVAEATTVAWSPLTHRFLDPLGFQVTSVRDIHGHHICRLTCEGGRLPMWESSEPDKTIAPVRLKRATG